MRFALSPDKVTSMFTSAELTNCKYLKKTLYFYSLRAEQL